MNAITLHLLVRRNNDLGSQTIEKFQNNFCLNDGYDNPKDDSLNNKKYERSSYSETLPSQVVFLIVQTSVSTVVYNNGRQLLNTRLHVNYL